MSRCRETARLVELSRHGALGQRSAPDLSHVAECDACTAELRFERLLEAQLQRAMARRVEGADPPRRVWNAIRQRIDAEAATPRTTRRDWVTLARGLSASVVVSTAAAVLAFAVTAGQGPIRGPKESTFPPPAYRVATTAGTAKDADARGDNWPPFFPRKVITDAGMLAYSDAITLVRPLVEPVPTGMRE